MEELKDESLSKIVSMCVLAVLGIVFLMGRPYDKGASEFTEFILLLTASVFVILIFVVFRLRQGKQIKKNNFYIVEDRLMRIENNDTKGFLTKGWYTTPYSTLHFLNNGDYKIPGRKKENCSNADYIAKSSSAVNEKFYLVIYNDKIIKCFDTRYYVVSESDFEKQGCIYLPKTNT